MNLTLDFLPAGYHAPFAAALEQGFYKQAGLAVHIQPGRGSPVTAEQVVSGAATFGFADFGAVAMLIAKNAPLKAVMVVLQEIPVCVATPAKDHITSPAQLRGRTFVINPSGADAYQLPAFLNANHVPLSSVKTVAATPAARLTTFETGKANAIIAFSDVEIPELEAKGIKVNTLCFPQYGVNMISDSILASDATIQNDPSLVKAFVAATTRGFDYTQAHPGTAIADLMKLFPDAHLDSAIAKQQLQNALKLLHTPATQGKPLGWVANSDVAHTLQVLKRYAGLKTAKPSSAFYTNQFIPQNG